MMLRRITTFTFALAAAGFLGMMRATLAMDMT